MNGLLVLAVTVLIFLSMANNKGWSAENEPTPASSPSALKLGVDYRESKPLTQAANPALPKSKGFKIQAACTDSYGKTSDSGSTGYAGCLEDRRAKSNDPISQHQSSASQSLILKFGRD